MSTLKLGKHKGPSRKYLQDLLPLAGITSQKRLGDYIAEHYAKGEDLGFSIVREKDLRTDSEGRIYDDELDFENVIVDVPLLNLQNSRKIRLINCLFTGDLWIGQKRDDFELAYLDHCIVVKKLLIVSLKQAKIDMLRVNAPEVHINLLNQAKHVSITECHFGDFCFQKSTADELFTYLNRFEQLEITDCDLKKITFDHRQFPRLLGKKPPKNFNGFEFPPRVDWGDQAEIDSSARAASTVSFIIKNSHINLDRDALANAKYRAAMASKKDVRGRLLNRLFGAFIMPKRILVLAFVSIIVFALLYTFPCCRFNPPLAPSQPPQEGLGLLDSVYFSGVTFLTIGYGDIAPFGLARFLALLEGIVGVTLMSSFVVALTRKYVD